MLSRYVGGNIECILLKAWELGKVTKVTCNGLVTKRGTNCGGL